jgi:hypothetical protein
MRAVLLSPVVVLVLWSGLAVLWTSKQQSQQPLTSSRTTKQRRNMRLPTRAQVSESLAEVVEVVGDALGDAAPRQAKRVPVYAPLGNTREMNAMRPSRIAPRQQDSLLVVQPANVMPVPNRGAVQSQTQNVAAQAEPLQAALLQGQTNRASVQGAPLTQAAYQGQQPLQASIQGQQAMQATAQGDSVYQEPLPVSAPQNMAPLVSLPGPLGRTQPLVTSTQESTNSASSEQLQEQQFEKFSDEQQGAPMTQQDPQVTSSLRQQQSRTVVYYYDPAQAVSQDGKFYVPQTVYDANGNAVHLPSIQTQQIYVEPPRMTMTQTNNSANSRHSDPDVARVMPQTGSVVTDLSATAAATDQSIVVATVGVLALLFGALSARKLRTRSLLSSCLDNEDEAAYDTAYTQSADVNSYHTFSWKQDLEKFDV